MSDPHFKTRTNSGRSSHGFEDLLNPRPSLLRSDELEAGLEPAVARIGEFTPCDDDADPDKGGDTGGDPYNHVGSNTGSYRKLAR